MTSEEMAAEAGNKIELIREAILDGYEWKITTTIDGCRWEITKSPFMAHIELLQQELYMYRHHYAEDHPEWEPYRHQHHLSGMDNPPPLQDILSPLGRITGISGVSGHAGLSQLISSIVKNKIERTLVELLKQYQVTVK